MDSERWRDLVSPKVGLIRLLSPQPRGAEEPVPPHLYVAQLAHFDFRLGESSERIGAGKGCTAAEAQVSAIGEAVERYCAFQWDAARTFVAPWAEVGAAAMAPPELVLYSEAQYARGQEALQRWNEQEAVSWMHGTELPSGRRIAIPASLAYLVHPVPRPQDYFAPATSNGLAAGSSLEAATLGALCELMERDAFLITWMNRLPAVELDLATAGELPAQLLRHYARLSVRVRAFVMPSDLPAWTIMALSIDPDPSRPAQVVGLGCHPDPGIALRKALLEMCQGRPAEARRFRDKPPRGRLERYEDVKTLDDHSAFHSLPQRREEFSFLWRSGQRARLDEIEQRSRGDVASDLDGCVHALAALGHRVARVDLTLPDVAACGFHVVRALVPGLQPVHFGHGQERLGGKRLFELPARLGLASRPARVEELNPCPHPLA